MDQRGEGTEVIQPLCVSPNPQIRAAEGGSHDKEVPNYLARAPLPVPQLPDACTPPSWGVLLPPMMFLPLTLWGMGICVWGVRPAWSPAAPAGHPGWQWGTGSPTFSCTAEFSPRGSSGWKEGNKCFEGEASSTWGPPRDRAVYFVPEAGLALAQGCRGS